MQLKDRKYEESGKRIQAPIFKGMIGERPEPHLLRAVDWFDSQGIRRDIDKVYNFKHTLDGEAREWYADYARQADVIPPWNTLINDFSRYYSSQGRGEKNLHEAWRNMSFTPATDDIEVFLRDLQECAKQLNYDDQVVITTIRAAMPQEVYGALYKMNELSEVIDFCKNYYAKSPKERLKAQSTAKLDVSPFKKIQDESPPDITMTLNKLTESLNKMDFTQKPYKPTLYPSGRGRGRGRGGRFQGRRSPGSQQSSYQLHQGRGRGSFRGKSRGGKFDKSPTKKSSSGKLQNKRCRQRSMQILSRNWSLGQRLPPKRRRTKRKETLKTPLQALVKSPKISMEQELQTCSMESQIYMWRVMKKTTS